MILLSGKLPSRKFGFGDGCRRVCPICPLQETSEFPPDGASELKVRLVPKSHHPFGKSMSRRSGRAAHRVGSFANCSAYRIEDAPHHASAEGWCKNATLYNRQYNVGLAGGSLWLIGVGSAFAVWALLAAKSILATSPVAAVSTLALGLICSALS